MADAPKTSDEKLAMLIERIKTIVPYVTATLGTGNTFRSEKRPDWIEVHGGRAQSSHRQLEFLLEFAKSFEKT